MARIQKVLVANRGEIALRVMRTCRDMGIATVAVFSDADRDAPFVSYADEAVHLGPSESRDSYLAIEKILNAAQRTGADAIHPGYGFLSENGSFAEACGLAGLTFIGPRAQTIRAMGLKAEAKAIALTAGVPVVPGYDGADQSVTAFQSHAASIGYPVLLKATAGGGGKGMRIVRAAADLQAAFDGAKREAASAFGDDRLLLEKYIEKPRHIEFQILGDEHDNLVHLFERECSIQRRHQKIIEESPSPALDADLRYRMGRAAVDVARAIDYSSAGTVEFILAPDGKFYFLEVNTRLQVEHGVTEMITGLDLVREQIRVARGEVLGYGQQDLKQYGAALECRICAEDPDRDFLPATGSVLAYVEPRGSRVRVDSGVQEGSVVGIHYDSMLAKVVTHGATRDEALSRMTRALDEFVLLGVPTNRTYLSRVLRSASYVAGRIHTHFLADEMAVPTPAPAGDAVLACVLMGAHRRAAMRSILPSIRSGFRNNGATGQSFAVQTASGVVEGTYRDVGDSSYVVEMGESRGLVRVALVSGCALTLERDGLQRTFNVASDGANYFVRDGYHDFSFVEVARFPELAHSVAPGACIAPMPGKITRIEVGVGESVEAGRVLLVLEAMKMEHSVVASSAGTVRELRVSVGSQVRAHEVLAVVGE